MAKAKNDAKLTTASVLAFERKIDPADALFYSGRWEDMDNATSWRKVDVREKSVRGTISNRLKGKAADPAKLNAEVQKPNLQRVDVATLPNDHDTLLVRFTLRVLGGTGMPSACNAPAYQAALLKTVGSYREEHGFGALAARYAYNLANGRFLWRNRMVSESVRTVVSQVVHGSETSSWAFDSLALPLRTFEDADGVAALASVIEKGLSEEDGYVLLSIASFVRMGKGQEVYPSQELILDKGDKGAKSKTLYSVEGVAGMHSQKIGNALRTIDDWYPGEDTIGPIAVEPYGSVTSLGHAFRQIKDKHDFYTLLDRWVLKGEAPAPEQQHYVIANLVRGGVFGEKAD
tara:strand:+ start:40043 stop:41080 length:1038 start_codon:yes stop_codon:yes gene_type:complete